MKPPNRKTPNNCKRNEAPGPTVANGNPRSTLAVVTADEPFWNNLLKAATASGLQLSRLFNARAGLNAAGLDGCDAVLLDLDIPTLPIWGMADLLLRDPNAPPLLLLTSRGDHTDFQGAVVDAGLIDKRAEPAEVLAAAERALNATDSVSHQRNARQHIAVCWLQPLTSTERRLSPHRDWGINE